MTSGDHRFSKGPGFSDALVCKISMNQYDGNDLQIFESILSVKETIRAKSFKFSDNSKQFIVSRACLKLLLSKYCNISPDNLSISYNKWGKPYLVDQPIEFNISHTKGYSVIAFTLNEPVGIDIELLDTKLDLVPLADQIFTASEYRKFQLIEKSKKTAAFFQAWTSKEAFIKAVGQGLSFPLKEFEVEMSSSIRQIIKTYWDAKAKDDWKLFPIQIGSTYDCTMAANSKITTIHCFEFGPSSLNFI